MNIGKWQETSLQYAVSFLIHSSRTFVTLIHLSFSVIVCFTLVDMYELLMFICYRYSFLIDTRYNVLDVSFTLLVRYKPSTWSELLPRYFLSILELYLQTNESCVFYLAVATFLWNQNMYKTSCGEKYHHLS